MHSWQLTEGDVSQLRAAGGWECCVSSCYGIGLLGCVGQNQNRCWLLGDWISATKLCCCCRPLLHYCCQSIHGSHNFHNLLYIKVKQATSALEERNSQQTDGKYTSGERCHCVEYVQYMVDGLSMCQRHPGQPT